MTYNETHINHENDTWEKTHAISSVINRDGPVCIVSVITVNNRFDVLCFCDYWILKSKRCYVFKCNHKPVGSAIILASVINQCLSGPSYNWSNVEWCVAEEGFERQVQQSLAVGPGDLARVPPVARGSGKAQVYGAVEPGSLVAVGSLVFVLVMRFAYMILQHNTRTHKFTY